MMTIEQFYSGYQPDYDRYNDDLFHETKERGELKTFPLPDNWKERYFHVLEMVLCFYRDKSLINSEDNILYITTAAGWVEDGVPKAFELTIEQLNFVAGILSQRGFNVHSYLSILKYLQPTLQVSWEVDKIQKSDTIKTG